MKTLLLFIAAFAIGRVILHLLCLVRDGNWEFHLSGIAREFK